MLKINFLIVDSIFSLTGIPILQIHSIPWISAVVHLTHLVPHSLDFRNPINLIRWRPYKSRAIMFVPEATIHKYYCPIFRKDYIRTPRRCSNIFSVTKTFREKIFFYYFFFCISASDVKHIFTANITRMIISHFLSTPADLRSVQAALQDFLRLL